MRMRFVGYGLLFVAVLIALIVFYYNSARIKGPLIFSPTQVLGTTWGKYKVQYLEESTGRTLDKDRGYITTSEGESYTMLRAVWMSDKTTFDRSWEWSKNNLMHKSGDRLLSWLFGQLQDGSYGILTEQDGQNAASDADTDIALALILAYARWQDP